MTRQPDTRIGQLIRRLWHRPQRELAAAMGVSEKYLSQLVVGRVRLTPAMAVRLGNALWFDPRSLLHLQADDDADLIEEEESDSAPDDPA